MEIVNDAVRGRLTLPSVPRVVRQLVSRLKDPTSSLQHIVAELEQDPLLAARTLQLANSPYYSGRRSLASITDAVAVLGTASLQRLVLTVGLSSAFVSVPSVDLRQFWLDAMIAGSTARFIARLSRATVAHAEAAYLAGLLHRTGHLILCQSFPLAAGAAFAPHHGLRGEALANAEATAFGQVHPAVGAHWVQEMGFPEEVPLAIRHQLQPRSPHAGVLAPVLHLALQLAADIEAGDSAQGSLAKIDAALWELVDLDRETFEKDLHSQFDALRTLSSPG
jgi:HD-like signal output (HDOD) protein